MHGVGRDALRRVDGGGVAQPGRGLDVIGGQPGGEVAAVVPHGQIAAFADSGDGPAVAVLDPVSRGDSESAVVGAGDDHVADAGLVPVRQGHLSFGGCAGEPVVAGAAVEVGDEVAG